MNILEPIIYKSIYYNIIVSYLFKTIAGGGTTSKLFGGKYLTLHGMIVKASFLNVLITRSAVPLYIITP